MEESMGKSEREAFLADTHVGIISIEVEGRGPVMMPVWYSYKPSGEVWFLSNEGSKKNEYIKEAGRFTLCAQQEELPYKYVSVEGPVTMIEETDRTRYMVPLARRYLDKEKGDQYIAETEGTVEIMIRMRPEHWSSADHS